MLMLVLNFFDYAYVCPENFFDRPPPVDNILFEKIARLGQNPRKCWSNYDNHPSPPMLMASRRR